MLDPASKRYRKTPDLRPEARGGAGHPYRRRNADHQVVPHQAGKFQILVEVTIHYRIASCPTPQVGTHRVRPAQAERTPRVRGEK